MRERVFQSNDAVSERERGKERENNGTAISGVRVGGRMDGAGRRREARERKESKGKKGSRNHGKSQ